MYYSNAVDVSFVIITTYYFVIYHNIKNEILSYSEACESNNVCDQFEIGRACNNIYYF